MRLLLALILNVAALIITSKIVPGFVIEGISTAILAAIVLGLVNTFVRPFLVYLTAPINYVTLGLFTFVINALMLYLTTSIVPGFGVEGPMTAVLAAIVLAVVSTILSSLVVDIAKVKTSKKTSKKRRK